MRRIFINEIKIGEYKLDNENYNYLKNVLRFSQGQELSVFDGKQEASAIYNGKTIEITKITKTANESKLKLAIAQIKQMRLEWLIEKATEIGVSEVFLLETKFTQHKRTNITRLNKIAIEAAKQCQRISIPKIYEPIKLNEFIKQNQDKTWYFGHISNNEHQNHNIQNEKTNECGIVIGPEGGFEENESEKLLTHFLPLRLSQNVLRAETAALVGLIYIHESLLSNKSYIQY